MGERKEIRVFVSSPGDCDAERDAVGRALDELNRTLGEREHLFFQALSWEDLPPGAGNPQAVIDQHLGTYNVLVGVMWMRFGTPIPGSAGSGTEHEVQQALETWKRVGEPRVMFYFKQDASRDISAIDAGQLQKVQEFKKALQTTALTQAFHGTSEFESKLRVHLHKPVDHLHNPVAVPSVAVPKIAAEPYAGFYRSFREIVGAHRSPETGALLHVAFGSIAVICEMPVVIPVGQAFDFMQRGPRSVLASFEKIRIERGHFFDEVEELWPVADRPRAAGLGHTKYLPLPEKSQQLPGVFFVVTTRDLSTRRDHHGLYTHTPIEGIDYFIDRVIESANLNEVSSRALPLLGTGYANVRRTMDDASLGQLLRQAVTLLAIQKLQESLKDKTSSLRRAVIVVFSRDPQSEDEHGLWEPATRFLGGRPEQRKRQMDQLLDTITRVCK